LTSCGSHPNWTGRPNVVTIMPVDTSTTSSANANGETRLGCGTFCQTAGGYGGSGKPDRVAVTVSGARVTADADGYVPVTLTCNLSVQCNGVLALILEGAGGGKSDLIVDAGATRTLGVSLGPSAIGFLRAHGPSTVNVTADARNSTDQIAPGGMSLINLTELTVAAP